MTALEELSALLGVKVTGVARGREPEQGRYPRLDVRGRPARRGWLLSTGGRGVHVEEGSDAFRSVPSLNTLCRRLGRDVRLPRLTASDGRRAIRLLHEIIEEKETSA